MAVDVDQSIARDYIGRIVAITGLSATEIAREVGLAPSTLTRIYPKSQVKHTLSARTIAKIDRRFPGYTPPGATAHISNPEAGPQAARSPNVGDQRPAFASFASAPHVPIFTTTLTQETYEAITEEGSAPIELLELNCMNPIGFINRPPTLDPQAEVHAIYVAGSALEPRLRPGEPVFMDLRRPPRKGEEVIVRLQTDSPMDQPGRGLMGTLVGQSLSEIELEQYNPALRFTVRRSEIACIMRLIPWGELVGAY